MGLPEELVNVCICLGSPTVLRPFSRLDRSFAPLPFDRFAVSVQYDRLGSRAAMRWRLPVV